MLNKTDLLKKLVNSKIQFQSFEHEALFTVEDSFLKRGTIKGAHTKNLFLKSKKNVFFLFSCQEETKVDIKKVGKSLNAGNLSFAKDEYLHEKLGVTRGSVSPFGLLNDIKNEVKFFLDTSLFESDFVNFHPMINTSTLNLKTDSFIKFLVENNKIINIYDFNKHEILERK